MCPHDIKMEDISNVLLDTIMEFSNMYYFNAQLATLDHMMEKSDLNMALHDNDEVAMKGNITIFGNWRLFHDFETT